MHNIGMTALVTLVLSTASAQVVVDTSGLDLPYDFDLLENFLQNTDAEDFDFNTLLETLQAYRRRPLDLNRATRDELVELQLLSDIQIADLQQYIQEQGRLLNEYELQVIPSFDLATIRRILPFVRAGGDLDATSTPLKTMLAEGKNEIFARWVRNVEGRRGYLENVYLGDPNQLYLRYRHSYSNRLSYGFTLEKDAGEPLFTNGQNFFDFYSFHFFATQLPNRWLKTIAIGDFSINMGQGLVNFDGFAAGKGAQVMSIRRDGRRVRAYTSVNEALFKRGVAAELRLGKHWDATVFGSWRQSSANVSSLDTLSQEIFEISSLQLSGLHRTQNELDDKNSIGQYAAGGSLRYTRNQNHIALNTVYTRLSATLDRNTQLYSQFRFSGQQIANYSLDYAYVWRNFNFFGETALSSAGGYATLNGLLVGLDKNLSFSVLQRYFSRDYESLYANAFAESSRIANEEGIYVGLLLRPAKGWELQTYADVFRFPWLRFRTNAPSEGSEYFARLTYAKRRSYTVYAQARVEYKQLNRAQAEGEPIRQLADQMRAYFRIHGAYQLDKTLELRSRVEHSHYTLGDEHDQQGWLLYQDVLYKPASIPWQFATRFAVFDTDGFDSRIYAYENDVLYSFSIPAYSGQGSRFYLVARYKGIRRVTLEARYAYTYYTDRVQIGSGNELIDGPLSSQVKLQARMAF